ncbi:MAG: ankyrin repeat domain-containing protein [Capsulimonadaceae bacterium]
MLIRAAKYGDADIVKLLLNGGAYKEATETANTSDTQENLPGRPPFPDHGTALIYAAFTVHTEVVELLLAGGANKDATDSDHRSALMDAVIRGNVDCVKALIAAGVNVNAKDRAGRTALALARGHEGIVSALKAANAK